MAEKSFTVTLHRLFGDDRALPLIEWASALLEKAAYHVDPVTAVAFLLGAVATLSGARIALLGAALIAGAEIALAFAVIDELPPWFEPVALGLLVAGLAQGVLTLLLGEQAAGTVLSAGVFGLVFFLLWRGPKQLIGALGLVISRLGGR